MRKSYFVLSLFLVSSFAHASLGLDDLAVPFVKCSDKNQNTVALYTSSEGVAGIKVLGRDFKLDRRLNQLNTPVAEGEEGTANADGSTPFRIFYKNEWSIVMTLFTTNVTKSTLNANGKKYQMTCKFGYNQ